MKTAWHKARGQSSRKAAGEIPSSRLERTLGHFPWGQLCSEHRGCSKVCFFRSLKPGSGWQTLMGQERGNYFSERGKQTRDLRDRRCSLQWRDSESKACGFRVTRWKHPLTWHLHSRERQFNASLSGPSQHFNQLRNNTWLAKPTFY